MDAIQFCTLMFFIGLGAGALIGINWSLSRIREVLERFDVLAEHVIKARNDR